MKKVLGLIILALTVGLNATGGGLLHNTNQHIAFVRMMARGTSNEIDAVFTNPAGTAFMDQGWQLSLNIQSAYQTRNVTTTFPLFVEEDHTHKFKGDAAAPVLPSLYATYNKNKWTISGFFGVTGGGGKCSFDHGLPMFNAAVMAGIYSKTAGLPSGPLLPNAYDINTAMKGRQFIIGGQFGAAYRITPHFSGFAGFRMNYFTGNQSGYLTATLKGAEQPMANIALDCDQTGWGITPILGINYKWRGLTLAAKYEFKTNLNIENDTKQLVAEPTEYKAALANFEDGVNTPNDLPSVLYVAAGYEFIPNKLRGTVEFHWYDDKHAEMADDKQLALRHGTYEVLAGVEWDINKIFTVSAGFQNTDYGLSDNYQSHTSFACDSYSIGFGGAANINRHIKLNIGYFWTNYHNYTKTIPAGNPGYCNTTLPGTDVFSRSNKVFGMGIDYKF
ncbi:MAG: hypothetical protein IKH19_01255 [Muribaculaceae bacterium]|nr:hypothetical protein [Muribaculaceae bacterium]